MATPTILVIEAHEPEAARIVRALRRSGCGYRLVTVRDGLDGASALRTHHVDLVLCNLELPEHDALAFLLLKQGCPEFEDVPVIMLTSGIGPDRIGRLLEAGAADYLRRPPDEQELLTRVEIHLRTKRLREELRQTERRIEELMQTDALTGLSNRTHFLELGAVELLRADRNDEPLACILLDVDRFKQVNDEHGQAAGDSALVGVARALRQVLTPRDMAARLGGDEFAVLLRDAGIAVARAMAEKLKRSIALLCDPMGPARGSLTVSFGLAAGAASRVASLEEVLREAARALDRAKAAGGDCVMTTTDSAGSPPSSSLQAGPLRLL